MMPKVRPSDYSSGEGPEKEMEETKEMFLTQRILYAEI